ncbi:1876_t:CDS:2, partial [Entrophospora sp. SA101]
ECLLNNMQLTSDDNNNHLDQWVSLKKSSIVQIQSTALLHLNLSTFVIELTIPRCNCIDAPNSSESLEYSPQIDSNSNFISNPYGSNSYDPLLLTPEFSEPSNFENINFNNFNQPEIFNLSD